MKPEQNLFQMQLCSISGNTHVPLKERWHEASLLAFVHSIFLAYVTVTLRAVDFEMSNIVQSNVIWQVRQMSTINLSFGIRYSCLEQTESDVPPKINMRNCVGGHCTMNSPSCHDRDVECIGEKWPPPLFSTNKWAIYTKIQAYKHGL